MAKVLRVFLSVAERCAEFQGRRVSTEGRESSSRPTRVRAVDSSAVVENVISSNNFVVVAAAATTV
jgi:hypothetical protein